MEENREKYIDTEGESSGSQASRWLVVVVVLLFVVAAIAFGYGYRQQATVSQLTSHESEMNAAMNQTQEQLSMLTAKLNEMTAAQAAAAAAAAKAPAGNGTQPGTRSAAVRRRDDKRLKQIQTQLEEQQKQLKDTQDQVAKNRSDLEGTLSSTRDELSGSIAKTQEELVALERRGERNFYEFDLTKSKEFQHLGPVMLSLRKADPKHKNFDLAMIVDDNQLTKKHVNLYEPVWIHAGDDPQPVQIVVNKVDKNHVHGYVSEPRYRQSRVAAVSANTSTTNQAPASNPPNQLQPPQ